MDPPREPDLQGLQTGALEQGGYFDRADARAHGLSDPVLRYHVQRGRFERIYPGVYRLTIAPVSRHDDLLLAWAWSNQRGVISHASALALYGLSDLLPTRIHLTVRPDFRRASAPYIIHRAPLPEHERISYDGVAATTAARAIVDAAADAADPEQIARAVTQAVARGLATWPEIYALALRPHYRGRRLALPTIEGAHAAA